MDLSKGYIRLFRQFIEWEWFTDINTCHLFQYCLLRANHKNTVWRGREIKKGQFITSLRTMSAETGLSLQQLRTSLKKLTHGSTCELTHETTNQYSIITVKNYNLYQKSNTQDNTQTNKQITTDNNLINSNTNISLSIEERENLKKYLSVKKKNIQDKDAYIRKLIDNGDIKFILEKARKWQEKQQEKAREVNEVKSEEEYVETPEEREHIKKLLAETKEKLKRRRFQA